MVEINETHVGGKEGNKHSSNKSGAVGTSGKAPVLGMRQEGYEHEPVNHSQGEYVDGNVHTNSVEAVWAVFKCGLKGSTITSRSST
ncbi:MAG: transposase [Bryobacterales bacterium]|nr:transposase [Bryobacterales bacterium]